MLVPCAACDNGTGSDGNPCIICGGNGELNILDDNFSKLTQERSIRGIVWDAMLTKLDDIEAKTDTLTTELEDVKNKVKNLKKDHKDLEDKANDIMDKCNDIFEKVSE